MNERVCRIAMGVLSLVGIVIASYLTVTHYAHVAPVCALHGGCETVAKSKYAMLGPVPVSLWGLGVYMLLLGCSMLKGERAKMAAAFLTVLGVAFSGYLTYLELDVIHAICQWCVGSAVTMTLLCGVAVRRIWLVDSGELADSRAVDAPAGAPLR